MEACFFSGGAEEKNGVCPGPGSLASAGDRELMRTQKSKSIDPVE
jgi:hypothetical protein